jgi:hypothetical protein
MKRFHPRLCIGIPVMTAALLFFLVGMLPGAIQVAAPAYPPRTISGGTVVAQLHVSAGTVDQVEILQGEEPFSDSVRTTLPTWRLDASTSGNVLVVVNFRTPNLYSTGSPALRFSPGQIPKGGLPYPTKVVEPVYPANSMAEGGAVFAVRVNRSGEVSKVSVLQGLGDITEACIAAIKKWQFQAASGADSFGESDVFAICVVRRPVLIKKAPQ